MGADWKELWGIGISIDLPRDIDRHWGDFLLVFSLFRKDCWYIDEALFPDELKSVLQGGGTGISPCQLSTLIPAVAKRQIKKYNLDDFLEVGNDEELLDQTDDEHTRPTRADIIRDVDDDELEHRPPDPDADEDLEEDDYGNLLLPAVAADFAGGAYFDNGEGDFDDYAEAGGGDDD